MRYFFGLFILITSLNAGAQSLGETSRSVRSRAMGGVLVPFANTADAIFVNPAGLGRASALDLKLVDLMAGVNSFTVESLQDIQNIDADDPSTFNRFFGEKIWAQTSGKAAVRLPLISAGYLMEYEVTAELHNPSLPEFETYFRNDQAFYLGTAFSLGQGNYLGFSLKRIARWGGYTSNLGVADFSGITNISDIGSTFANKGTGYGLDMGFITELPVPVFKPTLTLVWQDIGSTSFTKTEGTDAPPHIEQNLIFGAGIVVDLPGLDFSLGLEARHLLDPEMGLGKKLHVGTEISLPFIDLRAGYNQGYLTYGVGMNFLIFHIDAVSYTEELGVYPGQSGDNRYMASLSIDLSFDANFNFTDNNGKRRKLKQRR